MNGVAIVIAGIVCTIAPIELEKGVYEIRQRTIEIPINIPPRFQKKYKWVRLYVSTDDGKTWKHYANSEINKVKYIAPKDGQYGFLTQSVDEDGNAFPAEVKGREPILKLFVNTAKRPVKWKQ